MYPAHHGIFRCHSLIVNNYPYYLTGVAVNRDGHIVTVDTSNDTVQVFNTEGTFLRCLGDDGNDMYPWNCPRKVAADLETDCVVVIEDPPSGEIVVLNTRDGLCRTVFPRVISPKAVTIDRLHRIIVVLGQPEPRIVIYSPWGTDIFSQFNVTGHLQEPVGVAADQKEDKIFVCDGALGCVKVFSYDGQFLYQFADGVPNMFGICMSPHGEVVLGDNSCHSHFMFYTQDGTATADYSYGFITDKFSDICFARSEFVVITTVSGSVVLHPYDYPHQRTTYSISMPLVQVRGTLRQGDLSIHTQAPVGMVPLNLNLQAPAPVAMNPIYLNLNVPASVQMDPLNLNLNLHALAPVEMDTLNLNHHPPAPVEMHPIYLDLHAPASVEMDHLNMNIHVPAPVEMDPINIHTPAPVEMDPLNRNAPAPVEMDPLNLNAPASVEMDHLNMNIHAPAPVEMDPLNLNAPAPVEMDPLNLNAPAPVEMDPLNLNAPAPVEMDPLNLNAPASVEMDPLNLNTPAPVEMDPLNLNAPAPVEMDPIYLDLHAP